MFSVANKISTEKKERGEPDISNLGIGAPHMYVIGELFQYGYYGYYGYYVIRNYGLGDIGWHVRGYVFLFFIFFLNFF